MDRKTAFDAFVSGRSAYLITTCDALRRVLDGRIPFAISAVPPFAQGNPAEAFTLIHAVAVTKYGPNRGAPHDLFSDYLTNRSAIETMSTMVCAPALLRGASGNDRAIDSFMALCEVGSPMPNFSQMDDVWRILEAAEVAVVSGLPAEPTASEAAAKITALFATQDNDNSDQLRAHE